ncbi:MAG: PEP-CTERM sorting domain-containing protein [Verrucomicrobiota bacterium]
MKRVCLIIASLTLANAAFAASGIWGSFIQLTTNAATPQWYDVQYSSALPNFTNGVNLGTYNPALGNTLVISGGEVDIFKNGTDNVTGANLNWRLIIGTTTGAFTKVTLGFTLNEPFNNAAGDAAAVGGSFDQKWAQIATTTNLLVGLLPGTYKLDIYFDSPFVFTGGSGTNYSNNGGANYQASFVVVPEPSTFLLVSLALVPFYLRCRRK